MSLGTRLAAIRAVLEGARTKVFFDATTLLDAQWTGISTVAAGLAGALLAHMPERVVFFLALDMIETPPVAEALRRATGLFLQRELDSGRLLAGKIPLLSEPPGARERRIGLFPTVKRIRRAFDLECNIIHDLSTLVLPYFHVKTNVDHHMERMMADLASNDLTVAVSAATRDDLAAYLGTDPAGILVVPNGVAWPDAYRVAAENLLGPAGSEPYVLILGTREPRKNVMLVFDMLARFPEMLNRHRFVFAGRMGWLEEQHALPPVLEPALAAGRILFPGFVAEREKYLLLAGAAATLYPSLFEGFGLPVLESLSAGTPAVASWSSSLTEVGGDLCSYFDPLSAADLHRALNDMIARREAEGAALRQACLARAAGYSWEFALAGILDALCAKLPAVAGHG